jgi:hypothetical protein
LQSAGHDLAFCAAYQALAQAAFKHAETDAALDVCERAAAYGLAGAASRVVWR